jgi:hypothetical protein
MKFMQVNANEWHLDSSSAAAGRSKLLHFAIYVPAAKECPLHLQLSTGRISQTNGFTSPVRNECSPFALLSSTLFCPIVLQIQLKFI